MDLVSENFENKLSESLFFSLDSVTINVANKSHKSAALSKYDQIMIWN